MERDAMHFMAKSFEEVIDKRLVAAGVWPKRREID